MRKLLPFALMISLLLCGCTGAGASPETFERWREEFLSAAEHRIEAQVIYTGGDDERSAYTLLYTDGDQGGCVEILEPKNLSGVRARTGEDGSRLEYDGIILDVGGNASAGLSPMTALPKLVKALEESGLDCVWTERDGDRELYAAELVMADNIVCTVWHDAETMRPVFAALRSGEDVELKMSISEFS